MSVTFWCPDAPTQTVTPYPEDDPEFTIQESLLPEINLANSNARAALEMLGLPCYSEESLYGTLPVHQLGEYIERLESVIGNPVERASLLEPTVVNDQVVGELGTGCSLEALLNKASSQGRATVISPGRDDVYLQRLAHRLLCLFKQAREHGYDVSWG